MLEGARLQATATRLETTWTGLPVAHGVSVGTVGAPTLVALGCLQPG